ncbi:hypothetical protein N656DRAFT_187538 [Canariomyces notabilis]|uniref:Uncharacterized protein n=1 Tax=Canariomyces notabilis TaxID=2074819 RepID=A0AAN6QJ96_9PEZI|nr:hypothetical protein N656DRAFT_187538 [Canariomyces arenarius]
MFFTSRLWSRLRLEKRTANYPCILGRVTGTPRLSQLIFLGKLVENGHAFNFHLRGCGCASSASLESVSLQTGPIGSCRCHRPCGAMRDEVNVFAFTFSHRVPGDTLRLCPSKSVTRSPMKNIRLGRLRQHPSTSKYFPNASSGLVVRLLFSKCSGLGLLPFGKRLLESRNGRGLLQGSPFLEHVGRSLVSCHVSCCILPATLLTSACPLTAAR